jgi:hypothetical protein
MPPIALERIATDDNTDTLTQATVQKMCALIRDSATDPLVQQCAAYAKKHFACGSIDPAALAWGVFWYVKHCVKFRSDEGTMMQVGERALDLLTAPAVLVRMKDPSEDCDGFTMLSAAMLTILGVPVLVTTVAVDLDDPRRWSHVFLCVVINGRVMPLDTSHGKAPGWMVPRSRVNRWQAWNLDGSPSSVQMPTNHGLHGYVATGVGQMRGRRRLPVVLRRRGIGQDDGTDDETETNDYYTETSPTSTACTDGYSNYGAGCVPTSTQTAFNNVPLNTPLTPAQAGLTPAQQAQLIAAVGSSTVSLIRTAAGGPYVIAGTNNLYNPATGQVTLASNPNALNLSNLNLSSLTANLPLILGAVLVIAIVPSLLGRK